MDLQEIREQIDSIDNGILELLTKRFNLCKDISSYKSKNNLNVKDSNRESSVINERTKKFSELGYNEDEFIENLFELIFDKSREKIRSFSVTNIEPKVISIIGGRGKMGTLFVEAFRKQGHTVFVSNKEKSNTAELAQMGDIVIVSVPIHKTEEVLKEIIPHLKKDALLTDFTSIKNKPLQIMELSSSNYVGGHPLFGPVGSLENKNFVLCPGRGNYEEYKNLLQSLGLNTIVIPAQEHDKHMAVIQCLTHFSNLSFAYLLSKMQFEGKLTTPAYELRLKAIKKMFLQDASLFSEIQSQNELSKEIVSKYCDIVTELSTSVNSGDKEKFELIFNEVKEALK